MKLKMYKKVIIIIVLAITTPCLQLLAHAASMPADTTKIWIPIGGNGYVGNHTDSKIDSTGFNKWTSDKDTLSVFVRLESPGSLNLAFKLRVPDGSSKIALLAAGSTFVKTIKNSTYTLVNFGKVNIKQAGYQQVKLYGLHKTGTAFAAVKDLVITGSAVAGGLAYIKDNHGNYFYWGHRGPSVHLNYQVPEQAKNKTEWFYNEITVPIGEDKIGSYFMADGFTGGYFGMQVNSPTERHVLFSIWSPFTTDSPESIPDSLKIALLKKGAPVKAGEFGGEGSGGQSYMNYPWVAGKTYAFLIHAQANELSKTTTFTAYFKETSQSQWQLIASFRRPKSGFYLNGIHSFLENFDSEMGNKQRKAFYGNQWIVDTAGNWYPITKALFTGDQTANINFRKDYSGGVNGNRFYLRNGGFFDDFTPLKTILTKTQSENKHPDIDFTKLP
ncbi:DUF3472 domain-containing protein [Mucilaginibacter sp. SP1R1]|uniref:DUF3472 domain-containing protein n=1 Tax=Mucilaginibacter sp. SP1R1 TaxID=2723091 RepID=UPI00161D8D56|nr:DUF3472 domain-containing protein [Mucilaginibacter sp. SP1R1]MBB6149678.1 hypothetical protein [Mucilaginibacter sp. SP1R1]